MGKNKSLARKTANNKPPPTKKSHHKTSKPSGITKRSPNSKKPPPPTSIPPTIPFSPHHRILLLGEGDLSFARSLIETYGCGDVIATVYESREELVEKYPHVLDNIALLEAEGEDGGTEVDGEDRKKRGGRVRYSVDAMKKGPVWKELRGKCDRVIFNFPHVGGKTKDVNRQVRYNQELLVSFFKVAQEALAPARGEEVSPSSIIVTLFEGDPYTLWNVRDLARHTGLQVERSFRFQAGAYPGYKHSRTLGVVKGKNGEEGGGWRGEERSARSYIFVRKGEGSITIGQAAAKKRREESSDDEEQQENVGMMDEGMGDGESVDSENDGGGEEWDGIDNEQGLETSDER